MILGITGGTGCGKTTLLNLIRDRGGLVLDCDAIYHELLRTDAALLAAIEARFPGVVREGVLDRKKLGSLVFSDPKALEELNHITHGAVKREVLRRLEGDPSLAAIDAIALFEGGLVELCDVTWPSPPRRRPGSPGLWPGTESPGNMPPPGSMPSIPRTGSGKGAITPWKTMEIWMRLQPNALHFCGKPV